MATYALQAPCGYWILRLALWNIFLVYGSTYLVLTILKGNANEKEFSDHAGGNFVGFSLGIGFCGYGQGDFKLTGL